MPLSEITTQQSQLAGALRDGLEVLDLGQQVTFQKYTRVVLPLDGYIFWSPTITVTVKGSLHYAQDVVQDETETYGMGSVTFSSEAQVPQFDALGADSIFVGSTGTFRYAFSQQQGFYSQAGLWHYFGKSISPAMSAQLLDDPTQIDPSQAVVSNSLPFWLGLNNYSPPYVSADTQSVFSNSIMLYPSFLSAPNIVPPYGTIHIGEADTRPLQSVPWVDANRNHYQLAADRVRITLYGVQNNAACDFLDCVLQYSVDTGNFGVMNTPIVRDGKRPQSELVALAMQKIIEFEVSYYQTRAADFARQLIKSAPLTFLFGTL